MKKLAKDLVSGDWIKYNNNIEYILKNDIDDDIIYINSS